MARNDKPGNINKVNRSIAEADRKEKLELEAARETREAYLRRDNYYGGEQSCNAPTSPRKLTPREKLMMDKERLRFHMNDMDAQISEINRKLALLDSNPELEKLAEILAF